MSTMQWIASVISWTAVFIAVLALRNIRRGWESLLDSKQEFAEREIRTRRIRERNMQLANLALRMRDELLVIQTQDQPFPVATLRDPNDRGTRLALVARELDQIIDSINQEEEHG